MKLKTIKLVGFKSFVDSTVVTFPGNMCAVVGPNGCGKSNVIDAVRWVMGESSAKNLRTESMADVIFNGTEERSPVGAASIELLFDNAEGAVGGQYASYSEISIRRQVSRDGQSDYFLNGGRCRRRDITDIFLGTGLGPRSYAIIEQGTISRLIESRPEDLRIFVEEAAGISKYRERRKETESRMRRTLDNLDRLKDIRDELERHLQHLKRQARAAERYGVLKEEESKLDAQVKALQWKTLQSELDIASKSQADLEIGLESAVTELQRVDTDIERSRVTVGEDSEELNSIQATYYAAGAKVSRAEQELRHIEERYTQLNIDLEQTQVSLITTEDHLLSDKARFKEISNELDQISPDVLELQDQEKLARDAHSSAVNAMQDWENRWDAFRETRAEESKRAEIEESRIAQIDQAMHRLREKRERLQEEKADLTSPKNLDSLHEFEKRKSGIANDLELIHREQVALSERMRATKKEERDLRELIDKNSENIQRLEGRRVSLETMQEAVVAKFSPQLEEWLENKKIDSSDRLLNRLTVTGGWEKAVEFVLGENLSAICVDEISSLDNQLDNFGDRSLSLVRKSRDTWDSSKDELMHYVQGDLPLQNLFSGILVAESTADAFKIRNKLNSGQSVVTREGLWMGLDWLKIGSSIPASAGSIDRGGEIKKISSEIADFEMERASLEISLNQLQEKIQKIETSREEFQSKLKNLSSEESQIVAQLSARMARQDEVDKRLERIDLEMKKLSEQQSQDEDELSRSKVTLEAIVQNINQLIGEESNFLSERDDLKKVLDQATENATNIRESLQNLKAQGQVLQSEQRARDDSIKRVENQMIELNEKTELLENSIRENQLPVETLKSELDGFLEKRLESENKLSDARQKLANAEHELREKESLRVVSDNLVQEARSSLEEKKISNQGLIVQRDAIFNQLEKEGLKPLELLAELPEDANETDTSEQLLKAAQRIIRLGPINLAAIDEYEQQEERKKYLDSQNDDLEEALATLQSAIKKIDKETRSRFKDTFEKVNEGLKELFPKVFGGGDACLEMTGGDLLNTGISIMARPPGKKNTTINQLSGGEKALTAIALVFSIFKLNPAPFCMLDEVDAPLDDANVERYARMVREMSDTVQFIFVTHNKITMEMADHLMGVTMNEPGISRLVSVDIEEAVEMAAS